jgi:hypothetical protein
MNNTLLLKEIAERHYDYLNKMVNDLASKCIGGEEATLVFTAGKVTIKLL